MLKNKIALITGAGRGIGRAIAIALAKEGAEVVINYNGSEERAKIISCIFKDTAAVRTCLLIPESKIYIRKVQISCHCNQNCQRCNNDLIFSDDFFHIYLLISFSLF